MIENFWTAIRPLAVFLEEHGLALTHRLESESFGDALAEYRGRGIGVRVVRDRLQYLIDIAQDREATVWFDLGVVREVFDTCVEIGLPPLDEQSAYVQQNWQRILNFFAPGHADEAHRILKEQQLARSRRLLGWPRPE
jgi:GNAT superfamily N-acetyltransferase